MKKLLVTTAVSTVIVLSAAAPVAFAQEAEPTDDSRMFQSSASSDQFTTQDVTMSSGQGASSQLQPAGTGTDAVPAATQVDAATYDQVRANASTTALADMQPAANKDGNDARDTLLGFMVGLVLGAVLGLLAWKIARSGKSAKTDDK